MNRTFWLLLLAAMVAISGCGAGGGSSSSPATGTGIVDVSGGAATAATTGTLGGVGGRLNLYGDSSVDVSPDGSVLVQFDVPSMAADFGSYKVTVTTDTTVLENYNDLVAGILYKMNGDLYESDGDSTPANDPQVTGLEVAAGATLFDNSFTWTLAVNRDIVIAGTVSLDHGTMDKITLESRNGSIWIKPTGVLTNEASGQGGGTILLTSAGDIIMEGTITASGRSGAPEGWSVEITPGSAAGNAWVTGNIVTSGADNTGTGIGGNAGGISIVSIHDAMVDATLSSDGGAGNAGTGGSANTISIRAGNTGGSSGSGDLLATGIFSAKGGASTGGNGGTGGEIELYNNSPNAGMLMEVDALLGASGGDATGAGSSGGAGGIVNITQDSGPVNFAGSIEVRGGQGEAAGGPGGDLNADSNEIGETLYFRGITALRAVGGIGDTGGTGGAVTLQTGAGGNIAISSDIHADGGNGVATGGDGGSVLYSSFTSNFTGEVTYSGGTGAVAGTVGVFELF